MKASRRLVSFSLLAVVLASAGWWQLFRSEAPAGQRPLVTLDGTSIANLREEFNAGAAARVLVLLSPT